MSGALTNPRQHYNRHADVRAEVIAADHIEIGVPLQNITIKPRGTFRRTYSKDVLEALLQNNDNQKPEAFEMEVCREGLYDMLPEGLFHQPDPNKKRIAVHDVVEGIKETRKEESDARNFFLPIEKEMYRQRILVELDERKAYEDYSDHYRNELFFQIWPDLLELKREYVNPLIQILPRAYDICGHLPLTEYCFSKVMGVAVNISSTDVTVKDISHLHQTKLGVCRLGVDAIASDLLISFLPTIHVQIGPVPKANLQDYLNNGPAEKALTVLCNYLLPAEADVKLHIKLAPEEEQLVLNQEKQEAILGFTSRI
ncbi:MAG: type VI secretion system baseplate subunit TssG [Flavobacteriales bacterium]